MLLLVGGHVVDLCVPVSDRLVVLGCWMVFPSVDGNVVVANVEVHHCSHGLDYVVVRLQFCNIVLSPMLLQMLGSMGFCDVFWLL